MYWWYFALFATLFKIGGYFIDSTLAVSRLRCRFFFCLRHWLLAHPQVAELWYDTVRYDTRCYFNVCSKADMSQLNLLQVWMLAQRTKKGKQKKLKSKKQLCSEVSLNSLGHPWSKLWRRKGRLRWVGFAEKERFKPGMREWGGDGILIIISMNVSSITTI